MSILVVHLVGEGLLFGADRNVTAWRESGGVRVVGQTQAAKVQKWPNREAIVGYVGAGLVDDRPSHEWLYAFIGRNLEFADFDSLASSLTDDLNAAMASGNLEGPMVLHLAGFEDVAGQWTPRIWFIRNTTALSPEGYELGNRFERSEEIAQPDYFGAKNGDEIRAEVLARAQEGRLLIFSFRQGIDLAAFNAIDAGLRMAMESIVHTHPTTPHPYPTTLEEWAQHVRIAVLGYSAYFGAFFAPWEQYVGGGADVVHVPWPDRVDAHESQPE